MEALEWLDECNDKLRRVVILYPDAWRTIWPIQKHVQNALVLEGKMPDEEFDKLMNDTKGKMFAAAVNYPDFAEHFLPTLEKWEN